MSAQNVVISQGTTISVSVAQPATEDAAGYEALTFTDVGEVLSIGEFGGTAQVATFTPLGSGLVNKRKGSKDPGTMSMSIGDDPADAGQILLKAGYDGAAEQTIHSFKVLDNAGNAVYFMGIISSFSKVYNDANTITSVNCNAELTSQVIPVAA